MSRKKPTIVHESVQADVVSYLRIVRGTTETGVVPRPVIKQIAGELGVDPKTVTRWLARADANDGLDMPAQRCRSDRKELTVEHLVVIADSPNDMEAYLTLIDEHALDMSYSTMNARLLELDKAFRAGLRGGVHAAAKLQSSLPIVEDSDLLVYVDCHEVPVWCTRRENGRSFKPWIIEFTAGKTRRCRAIGVVPHQPKAEDVAAVAAQMLLEDDLPDGTVVRYVPQYVKCDNGGEFTDAELNARWGRIRMVADATAAWLPHHKGKKERSFGTFDRHWVSELPGYVVDAKALDGTAEGPAGGVTCEYDVLVDFVHGWKDYVNNKPTPVLDGLSPNEATVAHGREGLLVPRELAAELALPDTQPTRVVSDDNKIFAGGRWWFGEVIAGRAGDRVRVGRLPAERYLGVLPVLDENGRCKGFVRPVEHASAADRIAMSAANSRTGRSIAALRAAAAARREARTHAINAAMGVKRSKDDPAEPTFLPEVEPGQPAPDTVGDSQAGGSPDAAVGDQPAAAAGTASRDQAGKGRGRGRSGRKDTATSPADGAGRPTAQAEADADAAIQAAAAALLEQIRGQSQ